MDIPRLLFDDLLPNLIRRFRCNLNSYLADDDRLLGVSLAQLI